MDGESIRIFETPKYTPYVSGHSRPAETHTSYIHLPYVLSHVFGRQRWIVYLLVICGWHFSAVAAATAASLPLAVEVGGSGGGAEAVAGGEVPGVEVGAPPGRVDGLPHRLPERHEHETVDPRRRTRALVRHHLIPCTSIVRNLAFLIICYTCIYACGNLGTE